MQIFDWVLDGSGRVVRTGWFGRRFRRDDDTASGRKTPENLRETRQNPAEPCVKPVKTRLRDVTFPGFSGRFSALLFDIVEKTSVKTTVCCFDTGARARPTALHGVKTRPSASQTMSYRRAPDRLFGATPRRHAGLETVAAARVLRAGRRARPPPIARKACRRPRAGRLCPGCREIRRRSP